MKFRNAGIASLVLFCASCSDESEIMEADVVNSIPLLALVESTVDSNELKLNFSYPTRVIKYDQSTDEESHFDTVRLQILLEEQLVYSVLADRTSLTREKCLALYRGYSQALTEKYNFVAQTREEKVFGKLMEVDDGLLSKDSKLRVSMGCQLLDTSKLEKFSLRIDSVQLSALANSRFEKLK
ncbi:hypothetical protein [Vibrio parahaemolyticus]|uniref:hypothetical protein n=2 Tax=Vibrio parahaemolyticus TaxID=670 RepID=UPI00084A6BAE|nr:hypothetical protein [Vibrio parahaemolyticus]EGQ9250139.1 hypothetical protein [Vibrio parahaemolyticus]EJG1192763.1 hypothetical protein [Vibrio parahaemolyticus]EJI6691034.1 hypothetical protein [Vibrio parahaemolyticus]EJU9841414.1 hypothetical protein [Vibrio parahaemolyticus]EKO5219640.1 hypothetical protein [Vibrio parahaemolyticus]